MMIIINKWFDARLNSTYSYAYSHTIHTTRTTITNNNNNNSNKDNNIEKKEIKVLIELNDRRHFSMKLSHLQW